MLISYDMTNAEYHSRPELSRSHVHRFKGRLGGKTQSFVQRGGTVFAGNASTDLGTNLDTAFVATVEKRTLDSVFVVPPAGVLATDGSRRGKAYTEWKSSLPAGAAEVSAATRKQIDDMIASILEHDRARELIEQTTSTQTSVFWTDADGFDRKARADGTTRELWYDLKTTASEWRDVYKSFIRFGYHWQAAWYTEAAIASGYEKHFRMPFIVVQTFAPYTVEVFTLPDRLVEQAAREIRETLFEMRRRIETGKYLPDDYGQERELHFPEYVYSAE